MFRRMNVFLIALYLGEVNRAPLMTLTYYSLQITPEFNKPTAHINILPPKAKIRLLVVFYKTNSASQVMKRSGKIK